MQTQENRVKIKVVFCYHIPSAYFQAIEFGPEAIFGELREQSCRWSLVKAENAIEHEYLSFGYT